MRRLMLTVFLAMVLVVSAATGAFAGRFHFTTLDFSSGSFIFSGTAVGLGNGEYTLYLEATAAVTAQCENKGGTQASGRNALSTSVSGSTTFDTDENGTATVQLEVDDPTLLSFGDAPPSNKEAGCPNGNWSVVGVQVVEWTGAHLTVTDSSGTVVFDQEYACSGIDATLSCTAV